MAKRKRRTKSQAKKNSPFNIGDKVSFFGNRREGVVTYIKTTVSQFGTAYDVTVEDSAGKQYYLYSGLIDSVIQVKGDDLEYELQI